MERKKGSRYSFIKDTDSVSTVELFHSLVCQVGKKKIKKKSHEVDGEGLRMYRSQEHC